MAGTKFTRRSSARITGLETEYGCLLASPGLRAVAQVRDWMFGNHRHGLIDRHDRGWDEPPGNGGFLYNGGRIYVDMGHIEYCTPECASAGDAVRYDRAGDRLLLAALKDLGLSDQVSFFRNNIDHRSGATFGCHENYSISRTGPLTEANLLSLLAFLTLRVLFTGSGRVGSSPGPGEPAQAGEFQLSQRADYIQNDFYEWVQHNRSIINTRDEPLADPRKYRRLHLIHGDTNVLPSALYLKVGATRLVLDLLEANDLPKLVLADAVGTLRNLSHQPRPPWPAPLANGQVGDAVALLGQFRERARARFAGRDAETDAVLDLWSRVESGLGGDLPSLVGLVDWVTKHHLLDAFRASEGLEWNDPWLEAQDLEYHHLDPARGLGLALANLDGPWGVRLDDPAVLDQGPADTRAGWRGRILRGLAKTDRDYEVDWDGVKLGEHGLIEMADPFSRGESSPG